MKLTLLLTLSLVAVGGTAGHIAQAKSNRHKHHVIHKHKHYIQNIQWDYAVSSWYSAEATGGDHQGCAGAPLLVDSAYSVATFLVGCGQKMQICLGSRCVIVTRWDSGPYVAGREIDMNVGAAQAIGLTNYGVATVRWRPIHN